MFNSKWLLSRRDGPLRAIWLAAYCFKKLKKAQVTDTDISSSVDKIVKEGFDLVTYRVLAYLLLGVVRIYSKKVEYLFNDSNKVLIKIKDFFVKYNKDNTVVETLCAPSFTNITVPARFELDSFELDILEDGCVGNVKPSEDITLKDVSWKSKEKVQYSMDECHYEDCFSDHVVDEDVFGAHQSELNLEARTSLDLSSSGASQEKLHGRENFVDQDMDMELEEEPLETVKLPSGGNENEMGSRKSPKVVQSDQFCADNQNNIQGSCFCRGDFDLDRFCVGEDRPVDPGIQFDNDQTDDEHIVNQIQDAPLKSSETDQFVKDHHDGSDIEASIEKLQEHRVSSEECMNIHIIQNVEELRRVTISLGEEHSILAKSVKFAGTTSEEKEKSRIVTEGHPLPVSYDVTPQSRSTDPLTKMKEGCLLSVSVDITPQSQFIDPSGATTPDFLVIPTPARREYRRNLKKRKCFFDDMIVFPNKVIKQIIEDPSDLVKKRRKVPVTAFAAWKANRVSNLLQSFLEPLIPCSPLDFSPLSGKKRSKTQESTNEMEHSENYATEDSVGRSLGETSKTLEYLQFPDPCPIDESVTTRDDNSGFLLASSVSGVNHTAETLGNLNVPLTVDVISSVQQVPIAPETPVRYPSMGRPFQSPEKHEACYSSIQRLGIEEKEMSPDKDEKYMHGLLNEDINSSEVDTEHHDALSERTRLVGRCLQRSFLSQKKRKQEEEVNLMQLLEQRTKKESARIFYEILVLKCKGFVDMKQESAYGDILVRKTHQWDQAFGVY